MKKRLFVFLVALSMVVELSAGAISVRANTIAEAEALTLGETATAKVYNSDGRIYQR
ncbi:MAG: hypothetical protein IJS22_08430 [Lachnospiraceae bacterium]|nr:hypothetical protein [Lachnospiraceae bacterium]